MTEEGKVRIEKLQMMHAIRFYAFGKSPELDAWSSAVGFLKPRGLLEYPQKRRIFGRNNPPPSGPGATYGYEFFLTLEPGEKIQGKIDTEDIPGGTFAVVRVKGVNRITKMWEYLYNWCTEKGFRIAGHGLEEHHTLPDVPVDELVWDLWLPIER